MKKLEMKIKIKQTNLCKSFILLIAVLTACTATLRADGTIVGWGKDDRGQATAPDGVFTAISAGSNHSLALRPDGTIFAWGEGGSASMGHPHYGQAIAPAGNNYTAIVASKWQSFALRSNGTIVAWGRSSTAPTGSNYIAIASSNTHYLALRSDGTIVGWGGNYHGQSTAPAGSDFTAIAAGSYHSLALRSNGTIVAWGDDHYGETSDPSGSDYTAIAAGGYFSVALRSNGTIVAWGRDDLGQSTPPAGSDFTDIAAGSSHCLALRSDGTIVGWGSGEPGYSAVPNYNEAVPPAGSNYTAIAGGHNYSLALKRAVLLVDLEIAGPDEVYEDGSEQYTAIAIYDDASEVDVSASVEWALSSDEFAVIDANGLVICGGVDYAGEFLVYCRLITKGLLSHWQFDEQSGSLAADSIGENHGTLIDFPTDDSQWTGGKVGNALSFDGIDDYVEMIGYKGITGTQSRTLAAWIKTSTEGGTIVNWGTGGPGGGRWQVFLNDYPAGDIGALRLSVGGGRIVGSTDLRDGQWHHIAVVLLDDGSPAVEEVKLYVDGELEAASYTDREPINTGSDFDLTIGAYSGGLTLFTGLIDDVRIYDRALSRANIMNLYELKGVAMFEAEKLVSYLPVNEVPIADAGENVMLSADADCGAVVVLDGGASSDGDGDELVYYWFFEGEPIGQEVQVETRIGLGEFVFTLIVNDGTLDSEPNDVTVTVVDDTPPQVSLNMAPAVIWPPRNQMVMVTANFDAADNCSEEFAVELVEVTCNQQSDGDIEITDKGIFLRAKRDGEDKDGRKYIITYKITDAAGNETTAAAQVKVPHDRRKKRRGKMDRTQR